MQGKLRDQESMTCGFRKNGRPILYRDEEPRREWLGVTVEIIEATGYWPRLRSGV